MGFFWFYFLPTTAFSPGCKSAARQRRHGPPRQSGGVAQEQRSNCHLGVSGLILDGASVCFHRELCPPRMRPGRRRREGTTQALRRLALARSRPGNLGANGEQHPSRDRQTLLQTPFQKAFLSNALPSPPKAFASSFYPPALAMILQSRNKAKGRNCSFHPILSFAVLPPKAAFPATWILATPPAHP